MRAYVLLGLIVVKMVKDGMRVFAVAWVQFSKRMELLGFDCVILMISYLIIAIYK